jgi:iron(III) transport system ATP-binding protein
LTEAEQAPLNLGVVELLDLAVFGAETPVRVRVRCGALSSSA